MSDPTLGGRKLLPDVQIRYYLKTKKIKVMSEHSFMLLETSDEYIASMPKYINADGYFYYPSLYEVGKQGYVLYHIKKWERNSYIKIDDDNLIDFEYTKRVSATINAKLLKKYKGNSRRDLAIDQFDVMGETAQNHVQKFIDSKAIIIPNVPIKWEWCHLIAFSFLSEDQAQKKNNLVAGTDIFNGHMSDFETAVRFFVENKNQEIKLEVVATVLEGTTIVRNLKYTISYKGLNGSFEGTINALNTEKSYAKNYNIYERVLKRYEELLHNK
ncbi:hypothetical protein NI378_07140 [Vibrio parahaemolyticus]|nr:hypothetical protein NI378_07140 [Vibrio parahaemolyticus]